MSFDMPDLNVLASGISKSLRGRRKCQERMQKDISDVFFDACKAGDYEDDEGALRESFNDGDPDQIKEAHGDTLELGTRVYYAIMVEEGHVIGIRSKRHNHQGKRSGKVKGGYAVDKGFAPGVFFMQAAMDQLDGLLPGIADKMLEDMGREAGLL